MNPTTVTHVRNLFTAVTKTAQNVGVDVSRWTLVEGSKTYGNAWAIVNREPISGAQTTVIRLGLTKNEAFEGLNAMIVAFDLVSGRLTYAP